MAVVLDERTLVVQRWSKQEAAAAGRVTTNAIGALLQLWEAFAAWYSADQVRHVAQQSAAISAAANEAAGNIGATYITELLAALGGTSKPISGVRLPDLRRGADMTKVYSRPASAYRLAFALTGDASEASAASVARMKSLIETDVMLGRRDGEHRALTRAGVDRYRRIIHPEQSKSGSCGLCVAASDRVYKIKTLQAIHEHCECTVAPITATYDPGEANKVDLAAVYDAAGGSVQGEDLKRARFKVNEHGELGPVLTVEGQHFQSPGAPDKADPVARARRRLHAATDVLERLDGLERTDLREQQLAFQRKFIDHLRDEAKAA